MRQNSLNKLSDFFFYIGLNSTSETSLHEDVCLKFVLQKLYFKRIFEDKLPFALKYKFSF